MTTPPPGYGPHATSKGMAIASMVLGIIGLLILPIILGPLALILGLVAPRTPHGRRQGMAIAGIVLGAIDIAIFVIILVTAANYGVGF